MAGPPDGRTRARRQRVDHGGPGTRGCRPLLEVVAQDPSAVSADRRCSSLEPTDCGRPFALEKFSGWPSGSARRLNSIDSIRVHVLAGGVNDMARADLLLDLVEAERRGERTGFGSWSRR